MPPHRPRGHGRPQGANHIDLRYSADALKAISDLQLGSRPRAILKIRPPSSLDYRARHGLLVVWSPYFSPYYLLSNFSVISKLAYAKESHEPRK